LKTALSFVCLWLAAAAAAAAQTYDVTGTVSVTRKDKSKPPNADHSNVVVWLKPATPAAAGPISARFEIRQTHKRFEPHLLAVPVGSIVWFPNLDPFFHNVFSLYDGNRFDLGLYEAGGTHSARFDRPGICFIFCNIHPEMSAVVVVVDGPYALSSREGRVTIPNVRPGRYEVYAWHERARNSADVGQPVWVTIAPDNLVLPAINLIDSGELIAPHKNKYGLDYPTPSTGVIYK
jgi:plastocyanin